MDGRLPMAFPKLTRFVKQLIIALLGAFVLQLVLTNFLGVPVFELFALIPTQLGPQTAWQVVTYVLVEPPSPGSVLSVLIGMVFMWLILSPFELSYGYRRTAQLAVVGALGAGLAGLVAGVVIPSNLSLVHGGAVLYGSSPIAYAGIAAMADTVRGGRLMLFGIWSMTSKQLLMLLAGISFLMFLASGNHVMFAGALGAIGSGIGFVRWMSRPRVVTRRRGSRLKVYEGGRKQDPPKWLN